MPCSQALFLTLGCAHALVTEPQTQSILQGKEHVSKAKKGDQPVDAWFGMSSGSYEAISAPYPSPVPDGQQPPPAWWCASNSSGGCWPRLFLLGVQKAATTSVFKALVDADILVCGASLGVGSAGKMSVSDGQLKLGFDKEVHFFDKGENFPGVNHFNLTLVQSVAYTRRYQISPECPGDTFMDATPNYALDRDAAKRMVGTIPPPIAAQIRMMMIFREPVSRDLSIYNMMQAEWVALDVKTNKLHAGDVSKLLCADSTNGTFPSYDTAVGCMVDHYRDVCIGNSSESTVASPAFYDVYKRCGFSMSAQREGGHNRLADGFYAPQLGEFRLRFDRRQLMVVRFESMLDDPAEYFQRTTSFMGLPSSKKLTKLPHANPSNFPGKVESISCETRNRLQTIYDPWNQKLYRDLRMRDGGSVPSEEPNFDEFEPMSCSDASHVR